MAAAWPPGLEISGTPLRRVISRSSAISNGTFRTNKHPAGVCTYAAGESDNELLFLMFAEMDPNVTHVAAQPTALFGEADGKRFSHIPDFAVLLVGGKGEIQEVKSDRAYKKSTVRRRLLEAARHAEANGWQYHVATASDLRTDPRRENIADLWRRHRRIYTAAQQMAVASLLMKRDMIAADLVRALERRMGTAAPTLQQLLSLAANGAIFINLEGPVGEESLLRFPDPKALPPRLLPTRRPADDLRQSELE